jgi:phosphoserine phosphatase
MRLALFDLDNTLLAGDSDFEWAQFLIEKEVLEDRELLELLEKNGFPISAAARKNLLEHHARQTPMIDQITTERIE